MHPIEQLRYLARAAGEGPGLLAREAAGALASFGDDPAGLVTACRRLIDRQPTSGPLWWLAARVLSTSGDPGAEAWRAAHDLEVDPTPDSLVSCLPDDVLVTVVGWPEQAGEALRRRGDARVLVIEAAGEGSGLVRRLAGSGVDAELVPESGLGAATVASHVVLLEANATGVDGFVGVAGSRAAAAVARSAGRQVWLVAGVGRVLPARMWEALSRRVARAPDPWRLDYEIVPLDLVDRVVGPSGLELPDDALRRADCPLALELLRGPQ